jgi:hypothetical protein
MDSEHFDSLARSLGRAVSRRGTVGVLVGVLALRRAAAPVLAKPRKETFPKKIPVCQDGQTRLLPRRKALAALDQGASLGTCGGVGGETCVPLGQICNKRFGNPCCNAPNAECTSPTSLTKTFTFCLDNTQGQQFEGYFGCTSNGQCAGRYAERPQDVACEAPSLANCPADTRDRCCVQKPCEKDGDCPISGICCKALTGWRCCAPGQDCVRAVGCVTT